MNRYKVLVGFDGNEPTNPIEFSATSYKDAYFIAGQKIIENYPQLSDEECELLSDADMNNWEEKCDEIFDLNGFDISDVIEIDNDQNWS